MKINVLKSKISTAVETFCNRTSMHGFNEMYSAYTTFWKVFWFGICMGAGAISAYQIYETVYQYVSEPTTTIIVTAKQEEIYYPSLRLCYLQWYKWVDWGKVAEMGLTRNVLLYGFSFFSDIFTETNFNLNVAKTEFELTMSERNFTTMVEYYNSIARAVPIEDIDDRNVSHYFDRNEIMYNSKTDSLMFCNKLQGTKIAQYFNDNPGDKIISFKIFDETFENITEVLTEAEYNQYVLRWIEKLGPYSVDKSKPLNLTSMAPPVTLFIFPNVAKGLDLNTENDAYLVDVHATAFRWLSKQGKTCLQDKVTVASDPTCNGLCDATATSKYCSCMQLNQAIVLRKDGTQETNYICQKGINFIGRSKLANGTDNITLTSQSVNKQRCVNEWETVSSACKRKCVPACQIWKYENSVTVKSTTEALKKFATKNSVEVVIEYPTGRDIILMTQVDAQTWETFIGNVGGILGLWTGASILSFVQLIYLCCFANREDYFSTIFERFRTKTTKKNTSTTSTTNPETSSSTTCDSSIHFYL